MKQQRTQDQAREAVRKTLMKIMILCMSMSGTSAYAKKLSSQIIFTFFIMVLNFPIIIISGTLSLMSFMIDCDVLTSFWGD